MTEPDQIRGRNGKGPTFALTISSLGREAFYFLVPSAGVILGAPLGGD
jgi:hypothetical protein